MNLFCKLSFILLLICGPFFGSVAQLTVFNVSSSDITDFRKVSVQQQFEVDDQIESSTTFTYGLGRNWEIGMNLINLNFSLKDRQFEFNDTSTAIPFSPLLLVNAQKVFELSDQLSFGIGGVGGRTLVSHHHGSFAYFGYANLAYSAGLDGQYQFAAGPYIGNHRYLGDGPSYGVQAAFDAGIWYKKLHLLGDWISGSHQKGKLSLGFGIFLAERFPVSFGWQRSNDDGAQAGVIQFTFLPK
ncbi:MAG: hypothetical protein ABIN80_16450 [Dyadobacter sp.]|uniref:hypothetical protein n=1 Tax=Dyadobacter sp. TaxID=1914288 RepID=UPI00326344A7